jgi:hypothetical protein
MKNLLILIILMSCSKAFGLEDKIVLQNIKKLGGDLKKELQAGMKKSPKEALEICNIKAPIIEGKYKKDELKIGRVSLKDRNSENTPKEWMTKYIQGFHDKSIKEKYITTDLTSNRKGLLMPILTMPLCLKCHGENVEPGLYKEVLKKYPNDKAIGYKVGQIRGFFWAEYNK